jgi:hypothetical protein
MDSQRMTKEEFIQYLENNCVRGPKSINYVQQSPLSLPFDELKFIGKGLFNTVYKARIGNDSWIIKEGAYDLKFPLFKGIYFPLPRKAFDRIYKMFGLTIMPSHKSAIDQMNEYVLLARYFGTVNDNTLKRISGFDPKVKQTQLKIRENLRSSILNEDEFAEVILASVKTFKNYHKLKELVMEDDLLYYNYLPSEYLVLSLTSERKGLLKLFSRKLENHYIVQDCIEGSTLANISDDHLFDKPLTLARMIIFLLLAISMEYHEHRLIDSRPENGVLNGDWFGQTGNLILNLGDNEVKFVDTRWLNQREGNLLQKGIVVADLIRDALNWNLAKYVEAL